jgi:hypothetical protein
MNTALAKPGAMTRASVAPTSFDLLGDGLIYLMMVDNLQRNGLDVACPCFPASFPNGAHPKRQNPGFHAEQSQAAVLRFGAKTACYELLNLSTLMIFKLSAF